MEGFAGKVAVVTGAGSGIGRAISRRLAAEGAHVRVLEHKAAIDRHLESVGIPVSYTNVFWGGRSEIKPSEISPKVYHEWHAKHAG